MSNQIKFTLVLFLAFISCQRFLLPQLYALSPLIALVFFLITKLRDDKSDITFLILALLMCVDNGGDVYLETPAVIRYIVYFCIIALLIPKNEINKKGILPLIALYFIVTFQMLFNLETLRISTLFENLIQLGLLTIFVLRKNYNIYENINIRLILTFIVTYVVFDAINYLTLYEPAIGYMNYNSTKAILVLPFLYLLINKKIFYSLLFLGPLTLVLIANGTRFIPVMFVSTLGIILLKNFINSKNSSKIVSALLVYSISYIFISETEYYKFEASKVTNFFYQIATNFSYDILRQLEPVRMDENKLFFSRSFYEILFGSGLGSGLLDKNNIFSYISYEQYAFTRLEIDSGIFHGLHDFWTDIGLRFGLLFVVFTIGITLKNILKYQELSCVYWAMGLIILMCAFYSTAGVLLISIIYGLAMHSSQSSKNKK
jgi:hypothetical protein